MSIAILAGGQSRRMGRDKALLRLDKGGATLIERVAEVAEPLSEDRLIIAPPERGYADLLPGWRTVPDVRPHGGPSAGVMTALSEARDDLVLVLPVDAPWLVRPLLRWLLERADSVRPVIPWRTGDTRQGAGRTMEVLHGVYPTSVLPEFEAMFDAGERRLFRMVRQLDPILIGPAELSRYDPGLRSFEGLNAPEDLGTVIG